MFRSVFSFKANVFALALMLALATQGQAASQGKIKVHVTGLNNNQGSVRVALFNSDDTYSADKFTGEKAIMKGVANISASEANYTFENVPYGEYAIRLFHDPDNSGKFVTGMFGIPKLQYGFSNNPKSNMGPASYDKAKFKFDTEELNMEIKMQHAGL